MRSILISIAAGSLLATLAIAQPAPRYTVTDLGTLGGTYSNAYGRYDWRRFLRFRHSPAMPGSNLEIWVYDEAPHFARRNNATAYDLNDKGQAIGYSEIGTGDSTCVMATPYQQLRFEAVLWERNGEIQRLPPLPGDTVGFANGVNNSGQVVGASGLCSNTSAVTVASPHAVLWESDGSPIDLGHLEGTAPGLYNMATSINNRGEVVGAAQSADGTIHAFLWTTEAGMQDYGAFPGAVVTVPPVVNVINNKGQIVGLALDGRRNCPHLARQGAGEPQQTHPGGLGLVSTVRPRDQ
jgi:probable HAF family extracellular repeat protein